MSNAFIRSLGNFPLKHRCFVNFPDVHIQEVSSCKCLAAVFTAVGEHARKVDILNMVAQVTSISTSLSTDCAFVGSRTSFREFDNVFIQRLVPCKRHSVKTQFKIFIQLRTTNWNDGYLLHGGSANSLLGKFPDNTCMCK